MSTQLPPPYGYLKFALEIPPVSQQARADKKAAFQKAVRDKTRAYGFLLTGDVSVSVEWTVAEETRYETDRSPDVDNILKPLLDSLAGPEGMLIDDNQVQHVSCCWIDSYSHVERLEISLRYSPDEWLSKEGLFFVQLSMGLCIPVSCSTPQNFQKDIVSRFESALSLRKEAMSRGIDQNIAKLFMPAQRVFHRTRLGAFVVIDCQAFEQNLAS